jgi:hypothetical protein
MPQGQVLLRTLLLNLSKFSISLYPTITFKDLGTALSTSLYITKGDKEDIAILQQKIQRWASYCDLGTGNENCWEMFAIFSF